MQKLGAGLGLRQRRPVDRRSRVKGAGCARWSLAGDTWPVHDHRNVDADAAHREDRPGFVLLNHEAAGGVGDGLKIDIAQGHATNPTSRVDEDLPVSWPPYRERRTNPAQPLRVRGVV